MKLDAIYGGYAKKVILKENNFYRNRTHPNLILITQMFSERSNERHFLNKIKKMWPVSIV